MGRERQTDRDAQNETEIERDTGRQKEKERERERDRERQIQRERLVCRDVTSRMSLSVICDRLSWKGCGQCAPQTVRQADRQRRIDVERGVEKGAGGGVVGERRSGDGSNPQ